MSTFTRKFVETEEVPNVRLAIFNRAMEVITMLNQQVKETHNVHIWAETWPEARNRHHRGCIRMQAWNKDVPFVKYREALALINEVLIQEGLAVDTYLKECGYRMIGPIDAWEHMVNAIDGDYGFNIPPAVGGPKEILEDKDQFATVLWGQDKRHPYWVASATMNSHLLNTLVGESEVIRQSLVNILNSAESMQQVKVLHVYINEYELVIAYTYRSMPFDDVLTNEDLCYGMAIQDQSLSWITINDDHLPVQFVDNAREVLQHALNSDSTAKTMLDHLENSGCDLSFVPDYYKDSTHANHNISKAGVAGLVWRAMTFPIIHGRPVKPAADKRFRRAYLSRLVPSYKIDITN